MGPSFFDHPRIMASPNMMGPKVFGIVEKLFEFDFAVAKHIGIWSPTGTVLVEKYRENPLPVFVGKINCFQRDAKGLTDRLSGSQVLSGCAVGFIVIFPIQN
jgi:hypothetical protein